MTSRRSFCLICGFEDSEVKRMYHFPSNLEKSKIWQDNMGIKYSGTSRKNQKICCRHFTHDCFIDLEIYKLQKNAVPSLFSCSDVSVPTASTSTGVRQTTAKSCDLRDKVCHLEAVEELDLASTSNQTVTSFSVATPSTSLTKLTPKSIFRGIPNLSRIDATPRKVHLMKMVCSKEDHIRKLKKLCKHRAHDIKALSDLSNSNVVRNLFKDMPSTTSEFLITQLRCAKRDPKGRRWTLHDKIVALCLFKRSPKCYALFTKFVALPSKRTLLTLLERVPFGIGINNHLFKHINDSLKEEQDRCCVLVFDEMDIKEHLIYDVANDHIIGFEDLGQNGSSKLANRALVFMLQGLARKWKQPIAYYFSNNGCRL